MKNAKTLKKCWILFLLTPGAFHHSGYNGEVFLPTEAVEFQESITIGV